MNSSAAAALEEWRSLLAVLLLLGLGTILRLFMLGSPSLWLDENYSFVASSAGLPEILNNNAGPHPPFYFALLHFWIDLGRSEFAVRLPSAILGILSIPLIYLLGRTWFSERIALLGSALLTLAPLHVWYSQEARMYSLLVFLGLASMLAISRLVRGGRLAWLLVYFVSTLAGLYTHYAMIVFLLAEDIFLAGWWLAGKRMSRSYIFLVCAQIAVLAGFLPWVPMLLGHVTSSGTTGEGIALKQMGLSLDNSLFVTVFVLSATAMIAAIAAILIRLRRTGFILIQRIPWLTPAVLGAYTLVTIFSALPQATSFKRQLVIFLPYFLMLAATFVGRLTKRRGLVTVSLVFLTCLALVGSYGQRDKEDWREAGSLVGLGGQSGDVILFHASYTSWPFDYYYEGTLPQVEVSPGGFDGQLSQVSATYGRAWVILSHDRFVDPEMQVRRWIDERWQLVQITDLKGITVGLYRTAQAPRGPNASES